MSRALCKNEIKIILFLVLAPSGAFIFVMPCEINLRHCMSTTISQYIYNLYVLLCRANLLIGTFSRFPCLWAFEQTGGGRSEIVVYRTNYSPQILVPVHVCNIVLNRHVCECLRLWCTYLKSQTIPWDTTNSKIMNPLLDFLFNLSPLKSHVWVLRTSNERDFAFFYFPESFANSFQLYMYFVIYFL